jgi:vacuolar-type H+-ATPase subunit B/Vma2
VVKEEEFAIVFAAMGVNMETAHFFKQACVQPWHLHRCMLWASGKFLVMNLNHA